LFLKADEGGDFRGGFREGEGEFAVVHLLVGRHEAIKIKRKIFGGDVKDDANGCAWNLILSANLSDDLGFHFDSIGVGGIPELALFGGG